MAVVKMIWAQDAEGKLGSGSEMLWHVPADFKHFKQSTVGYPIIMGRKSWEALGHFAPLPQRRNIVVTRNKDFLPEGGEVAFSIEEAISLASSESELVWIAGGAHVYEQAMSFADELVVTYLDLNVPTNGPVVYAPQIDSAVWKAVESDSDKDWREKSGDARWKVVVYRRR